MEIFLSASSPVANMLRRLHKSTKALTEAQAAGGIGSSDKYSIAWDGDTTGKIVVDNEDGTYLVKISDVPLDLSKVTKVYGVTIAKDGRVESEIAGSLTVVGTPNTEQSLGNERFPILAASISEEMAIEAGVDPGVYALYWPMADALTIFTSRLESETIHSIDPKFLPEMGGGSAKKTVLYSGTPQKTETEGMGTLYVLTTDNLLEVAE